MFKNREASKFNFLSQYDGQILKDRDALVVEIEHSRHSLLSNSPGLNPLTQHLERSDDFDYEQFKFNNMREQRHSNSLKKPKVKVDKVYFLDGNEFINELIKREEEEEEDQFENCDLESSGSANS
jgi:hypothetical protein